MSSKIFLIKHAKPEVVPQQLPELWKLSADGRDAAAQLASVLQHAGIARIVSSEEIKSIETAEVLCDELHLPRATAPDLHEHDRSNVPHMRSGEFISHMELFFRRPDERVLGKESADEALSRFEKAVRSLTEKHPGETLGVVSHGTVIALLLSKLSGQNGFAIWRAMQLPSYAVVDLEENRVIQQVDRIN